MSAALSRMGIEVSPTTCGRIMEANRRLYGLEKPQHAPREKLEMPFKAVRRHQFWSADSRYIEEHLLPDPKPVYILTIFENFSRMVLASAISPTQNQWDFLAVLAEAIRHYGAPEALVTDGGGQFYSAHALQFYDMLGIRKERIEPGEPWQNYAETLFGVQRRMADWSFEKAQTWEDLLAAHDKWMRDYNFQKHMAHEERQDGCHSPAEVLGWVKGVQPEEAVGIRHFPRSVRRAAWTKQATPNFATGLSMANVLWPARSPWSTSSRTFSQ